MSEDLEYLRAHLEAARLTPLPWDGEDRNIGAFRSKEELVAWYGQGPGVDGEPYRDRGFYTRELAYLSRTVQPRTIVEFGTSLGIGTCLLHWLNPGARLVTVDINSETYIPGDRRVPMGTLSKYQGIPCEYVTMPSWEFELSGVDLCFIDADHSYEAVMMDSRRAWYNRPACRPWAIAWHDFNDRHPGVVRAVREFCGPLKFIHGRIDSDTVWIEGTS